MREWLSGRASPCQGERREFESRLPLHSTASLFGFAVFFYTKKRRIFIPPFPCLFFLYFVFVPAPKLIFANPFIIHSQNSNPMHASAAQITAAAIEHVSNIAMPLFFFGSVNGF